MARFIQLHLLTSYPPSNLNRDDLGRPKTAVMGNAPRLRVSSQSLKRAWRTSDVFKQALDGHIGVRTKVMGVEIFNKLIDQGISEKNAKDWARQIASEFGAIKNLSKKELEELKTLEGEEKLNKELKALEIEQLVHFGPDELQAIDDLVSVLVEKQSAPEAEDLKLLRKKQGAVDIALFGRMLASQVAFNVEAAAQVAHGITVHKVIADDDYFTAVDDLNRGETDMGAAHVGENEFAAGLFYLYICIDKDLLLENLSQDTALADKALASLIESAATVSPTGKQNSFASRARASYIFCEQGNQQPRSLSVAFLKPVVGDDLLAEAVQALKTTQENMDKTYGPCANLRSEMNARTGEGSLEAIVQCALENLKDE